MSTSRQFLPLGEAQAPFFVGVDLGGTNIKVGVVDDLGRSLAWTSTPTASDRGPEDGARRMAQAVQKALSQAGLAAERVLGVGLGTPGTQDVPRGMLLDPPNLPGWDNFPIRDRLNFHCGLPVTYANDANAAAYGEFWVGTGRELTSLVLLTLGTGIGCGIIVEDMPIEGAHSHGGECGHIIIDCREDARTCSCGQPGHLEAYASAVAVVKRTHEALAAGKQSSLSARLAKGAELTPLMLAEEAGGGDALATDIVLETARYLGVGVVNLMHTIDPTGVVLGGAMTFGGRETELGRRFLDAVRQEVHRRAFPTLARETVIDYASLGADAGYIGAAGLARLQYNKRQATSLAAPRASGPT